ncbi:MAG TPA: hypothetical protein VFV30_04110 [Novosphingobium sp.]|nr:hypothetical protein [Novosphingobium sp.]
MLQPIAWGLLALVHLMPALAFFRPATLTTLYRIQPDNPLFLLMHHRAALFVAVFAACLIAAFDPGSRKLASVITAISMLSFLWLWWQAGSPGALKTIAIVDLIGLPVLAYAALGAFGQIGK